jgi:DNA-binding protein HU-beta
MKINTLNDGRCILYNQIYKKYIENGNEIIEVIEEPYEVLEPYGPEWLYSLSFESGERIEVNGKLKIILKGVQNIIKFTDRPNRLWSPMNETQLSVLWDNNLNPESFYMNNPNGVLNIDGENHVIKIISCIVKNDSLECDIEMISNGIIPENFSNGGLFVDMNKGELVSAVSKSTRISKVDVSKTLEKIINVLTTELTNGGNVNLSKFGNFSVRDIKARDGRNPRTGEKIRIKAKKKAKFKPAKLLNDTINK